jgi:iron complex outermembrane receptor protein
MSKFNQLSGAIRFALFAGAASAIASTAAFAQDDANKESTTLDAIEVTGSRLKRAEIEGATPVVVIDRAQLDASGDISVADVLRDSTFSSFGNFKPQSGSSAQSLASIDLRGLGSGRTLVLIDGRRAPTAPMAASSGSDLNAIPIAAVERIEILSDGASAVYGSDAIGGVVNIILRKDFNGAELRYGLGATEVEGGDLEEASVVFGASNDSTRIIGGASSSSRGMVFTRDQIGFTNGVSLYGNNYYNWATGGPSPVPGFSCDEGAFYFLGSGLCSFNFNTVAANEASVKNKAIFVRADHQINENWSVYSTASQTKVNTFGRYAPVPGVVRVDDGTPNDINNGVVCGATCPGGTDGLATYFYHRFAAAGNRDGFTDATNSDFLLGFQGQLTDTIGVDVGMRRTDYKYIETGRGYIVAAIANQFANDGSYDLRDPYGADPSVLAGMTATIGRESRWQTEEYFGMFNFDLFEMGGGTSNAVFGGEYRKDTFQDLYDSLSEGGQVLGSAGSSSAGGRSSKAVFFEWLLPFTSSFDITLAGRFDDYSDYGNDFSPKVALRWAAMDNLTFRASFGQGFRAPGLDILTQAPSFSAEPVNDPASCAVFGEPADCQLQIDTTILANPNLASEQSTQFSAGFVWDPLDWLDVSLDYYNIKVEDTISQIGAQDIINSDLDPAVYGPIPAGFSLTRNAAGRITNITTGFANAGELTTDGIDLRLNTKFDFNDFGKLNNNLTVSWVNSYEIVDVANITTEYAGLLGSPDLRVSLANTWEMGDWGASWNVNYIDSQYSTATRNVGGYATNDVQVTWKAPWNAVIAIGATNVGDRYPELVAYDGRPWNFYLYDANGRTPYFRYTQTF